MKVTIEGSGRHVHVTEADLEALFGKDFRLEEKKALSQPGQFASGSKVDIVGPKGALKGVTIIGPCRKQSQVELSFTDARTIGITPPIRESGDLDGSEPCTLVGPQGSVELSQGVIVAMRHIHFTPEDAQRFGVTDRQIVKVAVEGDRACVLDRVVARVSPSYATFMHIDYDEMNGCALLGKDPQGEVIVD